jgi:hypothetical protein
LPTFELTAVELLTRLLSFFFRAQRHKGKTPRLAASSVPRNGDLGDRAAGGFE